MDRTSFSGEFGLPPARFWPGPRPRSAVCAVAAVAFAGAAGEDGAAIETGAAASVAARVAAASRVGVRRMGILIVGVGVTYAT